MDGKALNNRVNRKKDRAELAAVLMGGILFAAKPAYADWGQGVDYLLGGFVVLVAVLLIHVFLNSRMNHYQKNLQSSKARSTNPKQDRDRRVPPTPETSSVGTQGPSREGLRSTRADLIDQKSRPGHPPGNAAVVTACLCVILGLGEAGLVGAFLVFNGGIHDLAAFEPGAWFAVALMLPGIYLALRGVNSMKSRIEQELSSM